MKRCGFLLAALALVTVLFAGCSSGQGEAEVKPNQPIEDIVASMAEELTLPMPAQVDDTMLKEIFYIDPADAASYAGQFAQVNVSSANVIIVEAKDSSKVETIQAALEKRQKDVMTSFEMYLEDQYEIAKNAKIVTKGNYVALLMVAEADKAEEMFNAAFES